MDLLGLTCPVCGASMYLSVHQDTNNEEILRSVLVEYLLCGRVPYKGAVTPTSEGWHAITVQTHDSPDGDTWLDGVARFGKYGKFEVRIGDEAYSEAMRPIWEEQKRQRKEVNP